MTKRFRLQRVLDLKEQMEDALQLEVAGIEGRRRQLEYELDSLRNKWTERSTSQLGNGPEPLDPGEIEALAEYLASLERQIRTGDANLEQVEQQLRAKRAELETAYQERELLQRLKERRAASEELEERRRDTRALEDMSTSQYVRRNGEPDTHEADGHKANGHRRTNGHNERNGRNGHPEGES